VRDLIASIKGLLPQNEHLGQALRTEVRMYPEKAIRRHRELNAVLGLIMLTAR
jgi:hypothetical protein